MPSSKGSPPSGSKNAETGHDEWMTTSDVAQELGYTQAWVRTQIAAHRLPAQQHLSSNRPSYRIRRTDFVAFVKRWMGRA
jgi:hypothetical protein